MEELVCSECGVTWRREAVTGRKPTTCTDCRQGYKSRLSALRARKGRGDKTCECCGQQYTPITEHQRFCSKECSTYANAIIRALANRCSRLCAVCGEPFETKIASSQTHCSRECGWASRLVDHDHGQCLRCGKRINRKLRSGSNANGATRDAGKYCSRECAHRHRRGTSNAGARLRRLLNATQTTKVRVRICALCGCHFVLSDSVKDSCLYCSEDCRVAARRHRRGRSLTTTLSECAVCGCWYTSDQCRGGGDRRVTCSNECAAEYAEQRSRFLYSHVRRAKTYGVEYQEGVTRLAAIRTLPHVCGVCGDPLDTTIKWDPSSVDMAYPTLDHIIPLSRGGTHTWDNVQLAHFYCNSVKGERLEHVRG